MKQKNRFIFDMLDQDSIGASKDRIWCALKPEKVKNCEQGVSIEIPFQAQKIENIFLKADPSIDNKKYVFIARSYGDSVIRITSSFGKELPDDENNPMFEWAPDMKESILLSTPSDKGYDIFDEENVLRININTSGFKTKYWSDLQPDPQETFEAVVYPDGKTAVPFMSYDSFFPQQPESYSLAFVTKKGKVDRCLYSLHANLSGKTFILENTDGLGVNSRRAYKNIPFYISSQGYGLLIMTSSHVRLSLADISTRAAQGMIEDDVLDLFFIGGGSVDKK